jgi:uncharacterized membrane protein
MKKNFVHWKSLRKEIVQRFNTASRRPDFIIYFIMVIMLIGLLSVGLVFNIECKLTKEQFCHSFSNIHVILSIVSYFIALLTASAVDLILSTKELKDESLRSSLIMIGLGSIILGLCIMIFVIVFENIPKIGYGLAIFGVFLSWFIWWIANFSNQNWAPYLTTESLGGGIPSTDPNQPSFNVTGSTQEFKTN